MLTPSPLPTGPKRPLIRRPPSHVRPPLRLSRGPRHRLPPEMADHLARRDVVQCAEADGRLLLLTTTRHLWDKELEVVEVA